MSREESLSNTVDYQQHLIKSLSNKHEAKLYLKVALEEYEKDGDIESLMLAFRNIAEAQGISVNNN